jgi:hypothetical protein
LKQVKAFVALHEHYMSQSFCTFVCMPLNSSGSSTLHTTTIIALVEYGRYFSNDSRGMLATERTTRYCGSSVLKKQRRSFFLVTDVSFNGSKSLSGQL